MIETGFYAVEEASLPLLEKPDWFERHMFDGDLASTWLHGGIGHLAAFLDALVERARAVQAAGHVTLHPNLEVARSQRQRAHAP